MDARHKIFLMGITFSLISLWIGNILLTTETLPAQISSGVALFSIGGTTLLTFHIAAQKCSKNITTTNLLSLYFYGLLIQLLGRYRRHKIKNASNNPLKTQTELLMKILQRNAETEYGRKVGLGYAFTVDEFRKRQPLSNYGQFEEYIERTAKGEDNVLIPQRPMQLVLTSGTTGKAKMIPLSAERKMHLAFTGVSVMMSIIKEQLPSLSMTQKMCQVYTHPTEYFSEAGIVKSALVRFSEKDLQMLPNVPTPAAGFRICTEIEAMYVHAIFALKDETLGAITSPFCTMICNFFKVIETNWQDIVQDISKGIIKEDLNIPADIRNELNSFLEPDAMRAEELRREFERGFSGIAKRVWPHLTCLFGIVSPVLEMYADLLANKYATDVLLYSCFYISSEGLLGMNLWPTSREHKYHYFLLIDLTFFEFIPLENSHEDQPQTLLIDEVIEGKSYELVITNIDGLYRFRFGDVIRVVGFYNKSPIIEFQFRIGDLMNLRGEKISEDCIQRAISDTVASWDADLIDYSCAESHLVETVEGVKKPATVPNYVLFVEIQSRTDRKETVQKDKFDDILRNQVPMYDSYRKMNALGLARLVLVQSGSFNKLREYIIENSTAAPMQFKMPRRLRKKEWIDLLLKDSS